MKPNSLYKWAFVFILAIASFSSAFADTEITSLDQLASGATFRTYYYVNYQTYYKAVACSGNGKELTNRGFAGDGDEWTLENAGDSLYYIKNELGCYLRSSNNSDGYLYCTTDKSAAAKVKLTMSREYVSALSCYFNIVSFQNQEDGTRLSMNTSAGSNEDVFYYSWSSSSLGFHVYLVDNFVEVDGIGYFLDTFHTPESAHVVLSTNPKGNIEIPESIEYNGETFPVSELSDQCFKNCHNITGITLPKGIDTFGSQCFMLCTNLASITLPNSITILGPSCFLGCKSLASITLPNSITTLGNYCFEDCASLSSITLSDKLTTLGTRCFEGCSNLSDITFPSTLKKVGSDVFYQAMQKKTIVCQAATPPSYDGDDMGDGANFIDSNVSLFVPNTAIETYQNAAPWNAAKSIQIIFSSSEEEVSVVKTDSVQLHCVVNVPEYNLEGLKWTSSNADVATVNETTGVVTGQKVGDAVITATGADGSSSTTVHVTPLSVSEISLPQEVSITKTDAQKLKYAVIPAKADNQKLKWTSSNAAVASVDETTGVVTANKVGSAVITATATDGSGVSASTTVHVTPLLVSSLSITDEITLLCSNSQKLEASLLPEAADNKTLEWTSDNENVASVDQNGVVKGINVGTTNIIAKTTDGSNLSATCKVTVNPVVINLSTKTINLQKGDKYTEQTATVLPDETEHKELVWTASGNGVASVDANGNITAIKPGVDTLRCYLSYDSNIYSECRVIVYDDNVVYVGGLYYILHDEESIDRWATVTSIYGGKNTSLDANNVAQYYSGTISIPESVIYDGKKYAVQKVGSYAFNCQNDLQSIYVPRTVTEIESHAAIKAEKLNRVNVADESQLVNIGEEAFKWCTGLKRFTFDGTSLSMESINKAAFYGCTALEQVLWKAKTELQTIQDYAFFKCSVLNNFTMPNTTLSVGNSAFRYNAGLTDIQLSTSLNYIDEYAFGECGFSAITLPESLANIQAGAFINNEHLQAITLPEQLQGLGSAAFENNSALESVTFHTATETMTIGNNAFNQCPLLNKVYITNMNSFAQTNFNNAKANPANTSRHIYDANGAEIINVVLPKGTKYVNNNAFNGCAYIESIEMPSTMDHVNDNIFVGCSALKDVYCYATEVPDFIGTEDPSTMSDVFAQATLHVIYGHESDYKTDSWWGRFYNVEGCDAPSAEDEKVTSITLNLEKVTLKPDDTIQLTATVYPTNATNQKVLWSSSDDNVAMVTDEGFVLAVAEGEADIIAEAADSSGIKAVCHITVESEKQPVVSIVEIMFVETAPTIAKGETKHLEVTYSPENATNKTLAWSSAKPSVATVDAEGNVTGVSEGKAIITAKTTDGSNLVINCIVTVTSSTAIGQTSTADVHMLLKGLHLTVCGVDQADCVLIADSRGCLVYRGTAHEMDLPGQGVYIIQVKGKTFKLCVK